MPRGRMLNKKVCFDEEVAKLSLKSALFFTFCIPNLDREGKILADLHYLKGNIVPYRKDFSTKDIQKCLGELNQSPLVIVYGNEHKYIKFLGFEKNQNIQTDRESPSEIPNPTLAELQQHSNITPAKVNISKDKLNISKESNPSFSFEEIYLKYPNKVGKKDALRHFNSTVKTEQDWQDIQVALKNYLMSDRVAKGYIQNASTWFNQWRDWINMVVKPKSSVENFIKE